MDTISFSQTGGINLNSKILSALCITLSLTVLMCACGASGEESSQSSSIANSDSGLQTAEETLSETSEPETTEFLEDTMETTEINQTTPETVAVAEITTTEIEESTEDIPPETEEEPVPETEEVTPETEKAVTSYYDFTIHEYEVPEEFGSGAVTTPDEWEMETPVKAYVDSYYGLGMRLRCSPSEMYDYVSDPIPYGTEIDVYSLYNIIGSNMDKEHVFMYHWLYCCYNGVWGWCKSLEVSPEEYFEDVIPENVVFPASYTIYDYYDSTESEEDGHYYTKYENLEVKSDSSETAETLYQLPQEKRIRILGTTIPESDWKFISYYNENQETCGWIHIINDSGETVLMTTEEYNTLHPEILERQRMIVEKPVIYLYPEKETDIHVKLNIADGTLLTTCPKYRDGWNVTAFPDGSIINQNDGHHYEYLFWDAVMNVDDDTSQGFCIKGEDTEKFLREKLTLLGLNEKEMNDFIVYWLPRMEHNPYNFICFQSEKYAQNCKLDIQPAPDSVLRLMMLTTPLEHEISIKPQILKPFERKGFTVVEWGGSQTESGNFTN